MHGTLVLKSMRAFGILSVRDVPVRGFHYPAGTR